MMTSHDISVGELADNESDAWGELLSVAGNPTLFHALEFLAYHPHGRFEFRHLLVRRAGRLIAVVPGGLVSRPAGRVFRSPLGASVGGPAILASLSIADGEAIVRAVQTYALDQAWAGIEFVLAPRVYSSLSEGLGFALHAAGFALSRRWLCGLVDLGGAGPDRYASLFRTRNVTKTRAALRQGLAVHAGGRELLEGFGVVFNATYDRHGVKATHTLDELDDLMRRLPDRMRIYLARHDSAPVGGLFVMDVAPQVATSFYICRAGDPEELNVMLPLFAYAIDDLAGRGFRYLDLGPMSQDDGSLNAGVTFFKEGIGAVGGCRDLWSWDAAREALP